MKMTTFGYFFSRSIKYTRTNKPMTLVSVSVLIVCLLLMGSFILVSLNISDYLNRLGDANVIRVYPPYDATTEEVDALKIQLESMENVSAVEYVPKDAGLEEFRQDYSEYGEVFDGFEENPLPDKFILTLADQEQMENTVYQLKLIEGIENVTYSKEATHAIITIRQVFNMVGAIVISILAIISAFIISNTIRASMHYRRLEIRIMRFVGATSVFVSTPFIIEGFIMGFIGSAIAYGLQYLVYQFGMQKVVESIELLSPIEFKTVALPLAAVFVAVGVITGVVGSAISVRRYLKV